MVGRQRDRQVLDVGQMLDNLAVVSLDFYTEATLRSRRHLHSPVRQ